MHGSAAIVGAVLVVFSVGCGQPVSPTGLLTPGAATRNSPTPSERGADTQVPLHGTVEGTFTAVPDPPPSPFLSVDFDDVTGTATHLGRFTLKGPHRVNVSTTPVTATGIFELTAASGDTLLAEFDGRATFQAPGIVSITETARITGGTGRFEGATGGFVMTRTANQATRQTHGSFEGTINLGSGGHQ